MPFWFFFGVSAMLRPERLACFSDSPKSVHLSLTGAFRHTRRERLLELVGLLGVLQDEGVEVALAADLELDRGDILAALDARRAGVLATADLDELGMSARASIPHIYVYSRS